MIRHIEFPTSRIQYGGRRHGALKALKGGSQDAKKNMQCSNPAHRSLQFALATIMIDQTIVYTIHFDSMEESIDSLDFSIDFLGGLPAHLSNSTGVS